MAQHKRAIFQCSWQFDGPDWPSSHTDPLRTSTASVATIDPQLQFSYKVQGPYSMVKSFRTLKYICERSRKHFRPCEEFGVTFKVSAVARPRSIHWMARHYGYWQ